MLTSFIYKPWAFYLVLVVLTLLVIAVVVGNAFVLIALLRYPQLRSSPNILVGNLAVSDFLLALIVLPFSVANDTMGFWFFGANMCEVWLSFDVLCCTASIWGLVAIAFDRFTATNFPMWYRGRQSQRHIFCYVLVVWILSTFISLPGIVGLGNEAIEEPPMEESVSVNKTSAARALVLNSSGAHIFNPEKGKYECILFTHPYYVVYSTMGAIIIPMIIMICLYTKTFMLIYTKQKTLSRNQVRRTGSAKSAINLSLHSNRDISANSQVSQPSGKRISSRFREYIERSVQSCSTASAVYNGSTAFGSVINDINQTAYTVRCQLVEILDHKQHVKQVEDAKSKLSLQDCPSAPPASLSFSGRENDKRFEMQLSLTDAIAHRSLSDFPSHPPHASQPQASSPDTMSLFAANGETPEFKDKCPLAEQLPSLCDEATSISESDYVSDRVDYSGWTKASRRKLKVSSASETSVRNMNRRERKATQKMSILVCVFFLCWIPFALMYLVRGICGTDVCPDRPHVRMFVTWLGYANSAINPLLYAFLNRKVKNAWITMLKCRSGKAECPVNPASPMGTASRF